MKAVGVDVRSRLERSERGSNLGFLEVDAQVPRIRFVTPAREVLTTSRMGGIFVLFIVNIVFQITTRLQLGNQNVT
jgi:hypothetical protein